MKELSNHFAIIPEALVRSSLLIRENIALPAGADEFSCTSKIIFDQQPSDSDSGVSWNMSFRAVTKDSGVLRYDGTHSCVGVILTDGDVRVIGDAYGAPMVKVTPRADVYIVETAYQTPVPLEL